MQISPWPVSGERVRVRITSPKFPIALIQVYIYKYACASISTRSLDADTVAPFSSFLLFAVFFFDGKLKRGTKAKNENGRRKGNLLIHPFSTRPPARVCVCVMVRTGGRRFTRQSSQLRSCTFRRRCGCCRSQMHARQNFNRSYI